MLQSLSSCSFEISDCEMDDGKTGIGAVDDCEMSDWKMESGKFRNETIIKRGSDLVGGK